MRLDCLTAFRQLRRAPGTALAAILTLALGIGATTAVVPLVTAVPEAGAPAPDMDRLVALWSHNRGEAETKGLVSPADYFEWSRSRSLTGLAAWRGESFNVSGIGTPIRTSAVAVTPSYFALVGWKAAMGRTFGADDALPGAPRVIVLSQAYWRNHLSGRADAIGQSITLDGEPATIVGVLPQIPGVTSFFVPLVLDNSRGDRSARTLFVMA